MNGGQPQPEAGAPRPARGLARLLARLAAALRLRPPTAARVAALCTVLLAGLAFVPEAASEYGDVVLNRHAESQGMRPVVFPHWFHRIRFRCKVCHSELGFKMRAGANDVQMNDILDGKFCGMCHNNQIAWGPERCDLCHSGKPGMKSGIHGSDETKGPGRW